MMEVTQGIPKHWLKFIMQRIWGHSLYFVLYSFGSPQYDFQMATSTSWWNSWEDTALQGDLALYNQ